MVRIRSTGTSTDLGLPTPRPGRHDELTEGPGSGSAAVVPAAGGLTVEAERQLAALAGVELPVTTGTADLTADEPIAAVAAADDPHFARRLLRVAELVTFGAFVLLAAAAVLSARFGDRSLPVHELPFAGWGLVATVASLTLASLAGDTMTRALSPLRRQALGGALAVALLVAVSGVVSAAGGAAGPAWVLFLPVVLVVGAVTGPARGLLVGAGAAAGLYAAAGVSHTLTVAGVGRMLVLLPAFPAVGWSAGALARLSREAAADAQARRQALENDVRELSALLDRVAEGDLSVVPTAGTGADPATTSMAVAFADTLLALRRLARQMDAVSTQLSGSALEIAGAAEQQASGIEAQVAAVSETTTTIEQLAATAAGIAETAVRVSQYAGGTRRDVDLGAAAVEQSTVAMERIADRVAELDTRSRVLTERIERISDASRLIEQLARRTSILAVNAAIEAARAGDSGHGFTHVADEVGSLAGRARAATARIDTIVGELQREAAATAAASGEGRDAVVAGIALHDDVVTALGRIARMVDRTTAASREITEATRQQRVASDAVVAAMVTVTDAGDRYRAGGRRHAEAAGRLRDLSGALRTTLGRFRLR